MKAYRTVLALGLLYATSAAAGGICIDCATQRPSSASVNANDRMRGAIDESQWHRHNANTDAIESAAAQRKAAEAAVRASKAAEKASDALHHLGRAAANESNARAGAINRMYQQSPFKAGNNYGY